MRSPDCRPSTGVFRCAHSRRVLKIDRVHFPQVAACVRTKDFARFLPEWIAFHFVTGVDEFSVYDDNSADNTSAVLQPFIDKGVVRYIREEVSR